MKVFPYRQLFFVIFLISLLQLNCKKEEFYTSNIDAEENFFIIPGNINPLITRIVNDLKQKNKIKPFVNEFVKGQGYPQWQFAKISIQEHHDQFTAGENGDTLVSIPVVYEGTEYVNAIMSIKINTAIYYKIFNGSQYSNYGFGRDPVPTNPNANDIVAKIMLFEKLMYFPNDTTIIYHIKDNRLFDYWPADTSKPTDFYVALRNVIFTENCDVTLVLVDMVPGGHLEGCPPDQEHCITLVPHYSTITIPGICEFEEQSGGEEGWEDSPPPAGTPGGGYGTTGGGTNGTPPNTLPGMCGQQRSWVLYTFDNTAAAWRNPCTGQLPPILDPDDPDGYNPYIADEVIIDTSITNHYPCLVNIIDTLSDFGNLNQQAQVALHTIFGVNKYIHTIIRIDPSLQSTEADANTSTIKTYTNQSSDTVHYNLTINLNPDLLSNSTKEYIAATITHEAMHGYIQYVFKQYDLGEVDSNYVKSQFPLFWGNLANASTSLQEHNLMANNWVQTIANSLFAFTNNEISTAMKDSIYRSLGWGGLDSTEIFRRQPGVCDILAINTVARNKNINYPFNPNAPASLPPCNNGYSITASSLKLKSPCE